MTVSILNPQAELDYHYWIAEVISKVRFCWDCLSSKASFPQSELEASRPTRGNSNGKGYPSWDPTQYPE